MLVSLLGINDDDGHSKQYQPDCDCGLRIAMRIAD